MSRVRGTMAAMRKLTWSLLLMLLLAGPVGGCDDPCAELEKRLCEELKDKKRCKVIREPDRRELLSGEACKRMLKAVGR